MISLHKNFIKKRIPHALFLILTFVFLPPSLNAQNKSSKRPIEDVTLQLKWVHQFNFAGYYAAVRQGYYKEAGFNVTIKEGRPGMDFIDEVISGRADYGVEMPELLIARNNGKPVVVLAAIFQHSPQILLSTLSSGIKSPHDLIGKRVMWRADSSAEIKAMLINENVPLGKINFMELSWDINDLINGQVDAIHAYITDQPLFLEKAGIESVILRPITYGIDFYGDCLFTSENEIAKSPERVRAFRKASLKGWAYAMDHPEKIMDFIFNEYSSQCTYEYMRHEEQHIRQLMLPKLIEIGHMNPGRWKHIGDTFVKLGMLEPNYSLKGFIYNPNPPSGYEKVLWITKALFGILFFISLIALLLFWYNLRLNRKVKERTRHLSDEIEHRQKTERLLIESQIRLGKILETIPLGVWYTDKEGKIIYGNPAGQKIWEGARFITPDQFHEYKAWWRKTGEIIKPEDWAVYRAIKKHETSIEEELEIQCFDGSHKIILNWATPFFDLKGNILGAVVVNQDITDRVKLNDEMKIQKMILDKSQKIAHIGSWHLDFKANILTWSAEECRIFDKDPSESRQTYETFLNAIHPDDREMVDKTYTHAIKNRLPYDCIHRVLKSDGTVRIVREKSEEITDHTGKTIHSFGFTQDITEQKRQEEEREKIIKQLEHSLDEIKLLRNILPICSVCKNIRNDDGYYEQIESYFHKHSGVDFSHTICPKCMKELYPGEYESIMKNQSKTESETAQCSSEREDVVSMAEEEKNKKEQN